MRTFGLATVYLLGLFGLAAAAGALGSSGWLATAGVILAVPIWSTWFGFVARRWTALLAPICVGCALVPLMLSVAGNASGDGGAEAAAGMLFVGAAVSLSQIVPISLGIIAAYSLRGPMPQREQPDTH